MLILHLDAAKKDLGARQGSKMKASLFRIILKVALLFNEHVLTTKDLQPATPALLALCRVILLLIQHLPVDAGSAHASATGSVHTSSGETVQPQQQQRASLQPIISGFANCTNMFLDILTPHVKQANLDIARSVSN